MSDYKKACAKGMEREVSELEQKIKEAKAEIVRLEFDLKVEEAIDASGEEKNIVDQVRANIEAWKGMIIMEEHTIGQAEEELRILELRKTALEKIKP